MTGSRMIGRRAVSVHITSVSLQNRLMSTLASPEWMDRWEPVKQNDMCMKEKKQEQVCSEK